MTARESDDNIQINNANERSSKPLKINQAMLAYMKRLESTEDTNNNETALLFAKDQLEVINNTIHNENYYKLDRFGLLIRKNFQNDKRSPFGWVFYDGVPINIHINDILIKTNDPNIRSITIQTIKKMFPKLISARGTITRLYTMVYPDTPLDEL